MNALVAPPSQLAPARADTWADKWYRFRNRLLASARFQRWAARFPLTRPLATSRSSALFNLVAGFVYSQVLHACVRLDVFESLREGPLTLEQLLPSLGLRPEVAARLLDAAASLQLLDRRSHGRYGLGIHGAALLGNPGAIHMIHHHALLYRDLSDPVALLRGDQSETELGRFWAYAGRNPPAAPSDAQVAEYSALMANSLSLITEDILEAYPLARHRRLMDLGGGEGAFVEAAARAAPSLEVTLFDLPAVAERARARLARAGLSDRATAVGGDLFKGPLPMGADVLSLVRVVHDHDDAQALRILQAAHGALGPGGVLLVAEPMSGTKGTQPMADAYFGLYLFAMGQGRARTPAEVRALILQAGFSSVRAVKTRRPLLTGLLVAQR